MLQSLLHPWTPPLSVPLTCPAPAPGEPIDPTGFFDPDSLVGPFHLAGIVWLVTVLALVLACYLTATASLNRGFVMKWYVYWGVAIVLGTLIPLVVLSLAPLHAAAETCATNSLPFAASLAFNQILPVMEGSALWALVAFPLVSWALTRAAGWHPASGGFFHYRGCPWPRWNPFAS